MKKKGILAGIVGVILAAAVYYYAALPAINLHSVDVWYFLMFVVGIIALVVAAVRKKRGGNLKDSKLVKMVGGFFVALVVIFIVGGVLSSPIVNASRYQKLLTVEEGEFKKDIEELSYDQIPLLDRDTAQLLGDRKMGSMSNMVSQFEADDIYTQINYQDRPVRVTPLRYANLVKWFTNQKEGLPAYIRIDMADQSTEMVKVEQGIKYSTSDHFGRNIYRHLRFAHPTYIYGQLNFEIDEEGTPYWVAPVMKYNIGLFGGVTVGKVVLCNAVTGEIQDYAIDDVPQWIDRAYSADLLVELYDYYGSLKHGFLNSVLSQKDCLKTTDGYNYLAIDDDVWVYTGVTSVNSDQSNVGFVLMNQRTMETKYYSVEGATETSAMASAEGQVQNLKYKATFPLLLNISGQPTYFIALKDDAGLVKKYAMVNVAKYQLVAIGDTVGLCEQEYQKLLVTNGVESGEAKEPVEVKSVTGVIEKIAQGVIEGNSHYYIMLEDSDTIYDVAIVDMIDIMRYEVGDKITMEYTEGSSSNPVLSLK